MERTNVRYLDPEQIQPPAELIVGDLSFISLELVLPALQNCATEAAEYFLMVKPQFEIGKARLGAGGVVSDAAQRIETILQVAEAANQLGMEIIQVAPSGLKGPAGNVEYFLYFQAANYVSHPLRGQDLELACTQAVASGPK